MDENTVENAVVENFDADVVEEAEAEAKKGARLCVVEFWFKRGDSVKWVMKTERAILFVNLARTLGLYARYNLGSFKGQKMATTAQRTKAFAMVSAAKKAALESGAIAAA